MRAIPALLLITHDETQHPLIKVHAAGAVAKIAPAQTGAVIPVLIAMPCEAMTPPLWVQQRTNWGHSGSTPSPLCLPCLGCSLMIVPL